MCNLYFSNGKSKVSLSTFISLRSSYLKTNIYALRSIWVDERIDLRTRRRLDVLFNRYALGRSVDMAPAVIEIARTSRYFVIGIEHVSTT